MGILHTPIHLSPFDPFRKIKEIKQRQRISDSNTHRKSVSKNIEFLRCIFDGMDRRFGICDVEQGFFCVHFHKFTFCNSILYGNGLVFLPA